MKLRELVITPDDYNEPCDKKSEDVDYERDFLRLREINIPLLVTSIEVITLTILFISGLSCVSIKSKEL